jgi:hypothetical protein
LLDAQQNATVYQNLLFHVYIKLDIFRATHRPSSGAQKCSTASGFAYVKGCWKLWLLDVQQDARVYQILLFHVYIKFYMFPATHRPTPGV